MAFTKELIQPYAANTLTEKQYSFTQHLVTNGFNIEQAMLAAGYAPSSARFHGHELMQQPIIKQVVKGALDARHDAIVQKLGCSIYWRAKRLKRMIEKYLPLDEEWTANAMQQRLALDAIKELNKMCGDTAISNKVTFNVNTESRLKDAAKAYEEY